MPGELARDGQFRPRAQQREIVEIGGDVRLNLRAQVTLEIERLAPLMIDLAAEVFERRARRRALVGKRDRIVAVEDRCADEDRRIDRGGF